MSHLFWTFNCIPLNYMQTEIYLYWQTEEGLCLSSLSTCSYDHPLLFFLHIHNYLLLHRIVGHSRIIIISWIWFTLRSTEIVELLLSFLPSLHSHITLNTSLMRATVNAVRLISEFFTYSPHLIMQILPVVVQDPTITIG